MIIVYLVGYFKQKTMHLLDLGNVGLFMQILLQLTNNPTYPLLVLLKRVAQNPMNTICLKFLVNPTLIYGMKKGKIIFDLFLKGMNCQRIGTFML